MDSMKEFISLRRLLYLIIFLDGVTSALLGHEFMVWLERRLPLGLDKVPRFFLGVPEALFRLGAALQAMTGAWLLVSRRP
jgi:hypothetical protein